MFVFVIPLRNPSIALNWARCEELCRQTVDSALAQKSFEVRVILVCREFNSTRDDPRLIVIRRDFPNPDSNWAAQHHDKYAKISEALIEARKFAPCYIMKLDADDLVSSKLAAYVEKRGNPNGYFLPKGYIWCDGKRTMLTLDDFQERCGSSNIIYTRRDELPDSSGGKRDLPLLKFGHNVSVASYRALGRPLEPVPFRAAIYRVAHGENITSHLRPPATVPGKKPNWKFFLGLLIEQRKRRLLTRRLRHEFFGAK